MYVFRVIPEVLHQLLTCNRVCIRCTQAYTSTSAPSKLEVPRVHVPAGWVMDPVTGKPSGSPAVFAVEKGKRYRFRVIAGMTVWTAKVRVSPMHACCIVRCDVNRRI